MIHRSGLPLQSHCVPQITLQILQPITHQIPQLPLPNVQLAASLDCLLHLALQLARDDLSSRLTPVWLTDFLLHSFDMSVLLLQHFPDLEQVACQFILLGLHVLSDVLFSLLEGLINDEKQSLSKVLELVGDHAIHPCVEILDLDVHVCDLIAHLHTKVLKTVGRLNSCRLETSAMRYKTGPKFVVLFWLRDASIFEGTVVSLVLEVVEGVEAAIMKGRSELDVVGLQGSEVAVRLKGCIVVILRCK